MEDNTRRNATELLRDVFINYIIYKKEFPSVQLDVIIKEATFTALGGLDDAYHNSDFINALSKDFQTISLLLGKISLEEYKNEQRTKGIKSTNHFGSNATMTVEEAARRLKLSEESIRKAIRNKKLIASKEGKSYIITEEALSTYISSRKKEIKY